MKEWIMPCLVAMVVTSCGQEDSQPSPSASTGLTQVAASETPKPPHRYDLKDGSTYAYIAAVSEDEQKKGKASGDVLIFRYLGKENGVHTVALLSDAGKIVMRSTCSEPCIIIKNSDGSRTAFSHDSIIGAVFEDAIAGYLDDSSGKLSSTTMATTASSGVKVIPKAFRGEWDIDLASCGTELSDGRLRVSETKLEFYESDAEVKSVHVESPRAISIRALSVGEGQKWNSHMTLILSRSGNDLTVRMGGDDFTRIRCS